MRLLAFSLCILPLLGAGFQYREALPGYSYQFPRDHFEHQDFRTEWWYYTGNVTSAGGERFGFELVFFRQGERHTTSMHPTTGHPTTGHSTTEPSAWDVQDLYLAHAALTDAHGRKFRYEERLNRSGPGVAGASFDQRRIWNGNWSAKWEGDHQTLAAVAADFRFHLKLTPEKSYVIQGENGVSQKAAGTGRASHYVSFPRLQVEGTIDAKAVSGSAWMDHEWFTESLAEDEIGWDWFSIQLDNRTELMLYKLRRKDGSTDPYSSGTFIDANGAARHLRREDFSLEPLAKWHSYPIAWRVRVPALNIDLTSRPVLEDQELRAKQGGTNYWEGAVDFSGSQKGVGYIEMTGYEARVRF
ncbi:MAG: carotenoid 1,2-hydratase [Acidobacteriota bacterium]|nr:carotenoid 1,2-hydratase [Acidobacteriota bacterium]